MYEPLDFKKNLMGQPMLNVESTSKEDKPDLEVIIKLVDLYARAWEYEDEKPIFDNDRAEPDSHTSREATVRHDLATDKTCTVPGTIREGSSENFPKQMDYLTKAISWTPMRLWVRSSLILRMLTPAAQSRIYVKIRSRVAMTFTEIKNPICHNQNN